MRGGPPPEVFSKGSIGIAEWLEDECEGMDRKGYHLRVIFQKWNAASGEYETYYDGLYKQADDKDASVIRFVDPEQLQQRGKNQRIQIWLVSKAEGEQVLLFDEKTNDYIIGGHP